MILPFREVYILLVKLCNWEVFVWGLDFDQCALLTLEHFLEWHD